MRSRFVITGAPGSGKTRILRELAKLEFIGIDEPAREILAEQRANRRQWSADKNPQLFCDLMLQRAIADYEKTAGNGGAAFFDRGIPDIVGYAELFGLDTSAAQAASQRHRYDNPIFALPAWPEIYVTDGDRRMAFGAAQAFGDRVREIYLDLGYTILDVPHDSVEARARFIAAGARRAP